MAKDYAKFVPPKPRAAKRQPRHAEIILSVFLLVMASLAGGYYFYQKNQANTVAEGQGMSGFVTRVASLFSHHKKDALHPKKVVVANNDDQPPAVHFDFYSQLPSMQVTIPEEGGQATAQEVVKPINPPVLAKVEGLSSDVAAPAASKSSALNPDEVTTLLEAAEGREPQSDIKTVTQGYIIELGAFDTRQAAGLLAEALSGVGFKAYVVKINRNGRNIFSVQQGPFRTLAVAKSTQQRLQKRGIVGEIHKSV
ncbi:MAG: SPOR domain-containing protein [Gammaproteobacteria bacterium]|nr:SPOR domain-containing protein [Gammaproteobacteria bacterium]